MNKTKLLITTLLFAVVALLIVPSKVSADSVYGDLYYTVSNKVVKR